MSRMKVLVATMMIVAAPCVVSASLTAIEILPHPLETDSVVLNAELDWSTSGYWVLGSSVTWMSDFEPQIDIDVSAPELWDIVAQVLTSEVHSIDLGPLPRGTYSYTVNAIQTTPSGWPRGYATLEGTFTVVPEPTTMTVLALGGLAVLRRRKL